MEEKILSLCECGISQRDIAEQIKSLYDVEISPELVSKISDLFCTDGPTGFREAIEAVYPKAGIQRCIIHQIRYSTRFVSYKDIKAIMADLKLVYTAVTEDEALNNLIRFKEKWSKCVSPFSGRKPPLNIRTMSERKFYLHKIRQGARKTKFLRHLIMLVSIF